MKLMQAKVCLLVIFETVPIIMGKAITAQQPESENIVILIEEARSRAFSKVNAELVLLNHAGNRLPYTTIGKAHTITGSQKPLSTYRKRL